MAELTPNDLLGLAELFRLARNNSQPTPGHVFVLLPVADCEALYQHLLAESVREREAGP